MLVGIQIKLISCFHHHLIYFRATRSGNRMWWEQVATKVSACSPFFINQLVVLILKSIKSIGKSRLYFKTCKSAS